MSASRLLTVAGYEGCGYFDRAAAAAKRLSSKHPEWEAKVIGMTRPDYLNWLAPITAKHGVRHTSSPICFIGTAEDGQFIGGCDATLAWLKKEGECQDVYAVTALPVTCKIASNGKGKAIAS